MRAKRTGQGAVRVNQFERSLTAFNLELSNKLAVALAEYHQRKVEPLERRLATLEQPWRRKWRFAFRLRWEVFKLWARNGPPVA